MIHLRAWLGLLALVAGARAAQPAPIPPWGELPPTREDANAALIARMAAVHGLSAEQVAAVEAVFAGSELIGQGNPAVTAHPISRGACAASLAEAGVDYDNPAYLAACGRRFMAPLTDPAAGDGAPVTACIDQFEFPDVPCEYPVVWVRAREAEELCRAAGKRLCDAHEWEGGCAGALGPADYRFDLAEGQSDVNAVKRMRDAHNRQLASTKSWAYGSSYQKGVCAADSTKSADCNGGDWRRCGSNTYPAGAFPGCVSALGVYDQHGNAAEHMNLPLAPDQMASAGTKLGVVEMKGSWFIFDKYYAHEDWCRWRAPYWHGSRLMNEDSHRNYHLGFRCCADAP